MVKPRKLMLDSITCSHTLHTKYPESLLPCAVFQLNFRQIFNTVFYFVKSYRKHIYLQTSASHIQLKVELKSAIQSEQNNRK